MSDLGFGLLQLALFIPAIVLHEVSHGYVSYRLGDPTAKAMGRLSLNPIKHIDPFGTVLLPILLAFSGMPVFGYAKPVPINPGYYQDHRKGVLLSGFAGPATNLVLAIIAGLAARAIGLSAGFASGFVSDGALTGLAWAFYVVYFFANINLVLMFFNLIPIPPLDGSSFIPLFLDDRKLRKYYEFERYGMAILLGLLLLAPRLLGFNPISVYFSVTVDPLLALLTGLSL